MLLSKGSAPAYYQAGFFLVALCTSSSEYWSNMCHSAIILRNVYYIQGVFQSSSKLPLPSGKFIA